ncbi:alpha/beta fold hydrolase [Streptomyces phaeofaciens]|nr:alpha/beta hydrolase [Streptomyces phaeofaciens]
MYSDASNHLVEASNGVRYAYRRCGPSGDLPPLLMLQHFRGTLDCWDPALVNVLAAERDVITFDNAGVGLSTGRTPRTIAEMAADTLAFMASIGVVQADLLGFSMGGYTAQELALLRPAAVRGLVLAATAPRGGPGIHGWPEGIFNRVDFKRLHLQDYLYAFFNHTKASQRSGLEFLGRYLEREHDRDLPVCWEAREAQCEAVAEWVAPNHEALRRLSAITQPAFVAGGDNDRVVPSRAFHLLAGLMPQARLRIYPDAGHGFLFQHHCQFAQDVLKFFGEIASSS